MDPNTGTALLVGKVSSGTGQFARAVPDSAKFTPVSFSVRAPFVPPNCSPIRIEIRRILRWLHGRKLS